MKREYRYYQCCVGWPEGDVRFDGGLNDMIAKSREIAYRTFAKLVDAEDLADLKSELGYGDCPGLTLESDYAVSFHKSKLHGKTVYFVRHSAIEYVFTKGGE